jgi:phosphoheptose isomerase
VIDVIREIREAIEVKERSIALAPAIAEAGDRIVKAVLRGNKVLVCGNGGSAADAQHFAAELVGRFETDRRGVPAIALTTDTSLLTALANDNGYRTVFGRQVRTLGQTGDVVVGISTSGDSESVVDALEAAGELGIERVALVGRTGGRLALLPDVTVVHVPATRTARIQEVHTMVIHIWAQMVDTALAR